MNHATIRAAARISLQGSWAIMAIISFVYGIETFDLEIYKKSESIIP